MGKDNIIIIIITIIIIIIIIIIKNYYYYIIIKNSSESHIILVIRTWMVTLGYSKFVKRLWRQDPHVFKPGLYSDFHHHEWK